MITFACACGTNLQITDDNAGKTITCPNCGATSLAPPAKNVHGVLTISNPEVSSLASSEDESLDDKRIADREPVPNDFLRPAQSADELGRLGHFRILKELGQGGMGVVYLAEDVRLLRHVALKVMLPKFASNAKSKERFLREARTAASIENDHIIAIFEVDEDNGIPFLTMPVLKGESLQERLQRHNLLPVGEVLRIGWQICQGLQSAHERDLVHRDLKPGNLWLEGSRGRVKILDFGLARAVHTDQQLTQSGAIIGTPAYMAPEQARSPKVDGRADLFSLGVVLYRCLVGQAPFTGHDAMSVMLSVCNDEPAPPDEKISEIPAELSNLIMKLLQKDPDRRFASAEELGFALEAIDRKYFMGQAIPGSSLPPAVMPSIPIAQAIPVKAVAPAAAATGVPKLQATQDSSPFGFKNAPATMQLVPSKTTDLAESPKPGPRRRVVAIILVAALPVFSALLLFLLWSRREPNPPPEPPPGPNPAVVDRRVPLDFLRRENIPRASLAWLGGGDPDRAPPELVAILGDGRFRVLGDNCKPNASPDGKWIAVPSGHDVMLFDAATGSYVRSFHGHTDQVYSSVFSPDGQTLASSGRDSIIRLWDIATGRPLQTLPGHRGPVPYLTFNTEGTRLASGGDDHTICIWDVRGAKMITQLKGHNSIVSSVAFHPKDDIVASGSWDWTVRVWDIDTSTQQQCFRAEGARDKPGGFRDLLGVSFSRDGKRLAGGNDNELNVWDTTTWNRTLFARTPAQFLAFTPDGEHLLTCGEHGGAGSHALKRWRLDTSHLLDTVPLDVPDDLGFLSSLSSDGKTLIACNGSECVVRLFDVATGKSRFPEPGHTERLENVAFSPDGKLLASCGFDRVIRLWDLATGREKSQLRGHGAIVNHVVFLGDSETLASCSHDRTVRLWNVKNGKPLWTFADYESGVFRFAVSADGKLLASGSDDRTVRLWDLPGRALLQTFRGFKSPIRSVAFSKDGKYLAASSEEGLCQIWDPNTGKQLRAFRKNDTLEGLVFLPDNHLLVGGLPGLLREYSVEADAFVQTLPFAPLRPVTLQARSDGRLVIAAGYGGGVQLWDWASKPPLKQTMRLFPHHTWLPGAAFSPDGRHFATANRDGTVYIFRLANSDAKELPGLTRPDFVIQPCQQFSGHQKMALSVAFSRDGKKAFSTSFDGTARVWSLASGTELLRFKHPDTVFRLRESRDNRLLATVCHDGIARIWDLATGAEARRLDGTHSGWVLALSPNGKQVLTGHPEEEITILSDFETGNEISRFRLGGDIAWLPDGKRWLSCLVRHLRIADAETGSIVLPLYGHGHRSWIRDLAISPDGRLGLSCSGGSGPGTIGAWNLEDDSSVRLWDLTTGQQLRCWEESPFTRFGVAFTPGGRRAVAGSYDGTVRVYDIATGAQLACLESPCAVHGVAVSPDGATVLGGCSDGILRLWRLPDDIADPPLTKK